MINMSEARRERLSNISENFHKALVVNVPVVRIPEATFVNEILPYMAGETSGKEVALTIAGAAGGPFHEYDVVDSEGTVLFRAPALLERAMFDFKEFGKGIAMENIFHTAGLLNNRSPRQAAAFIDKNLTGRGLSKNAKDIYLKLLARRQEILARYGKAPVDEKTTTSNSSSTDTGIDYDNSVLL